MKKTLLLLFSFVFIVSAFAQFEYNYIQSYVYNVKDFPIYHIQKQKEAQVITAKEMNKGKTKTYDCNTTRMGE